MKRKKCMAVLMAGIFALAVPVIGQAEDNYNVWIDESELKRENDCLNVEIKTDGKSTDGLLVISYDKTVLQVDAEDVVWAETVEMNSANVVEEGTLKIAYLAEDAIEEGVLATIKFTTNEKSVNNVISLEGDVHDENEQGLKAGVVKATTDSKEPEQQGPENTKPAEGKPAEKESTDKSQNIDTGDRNRPGLWAVAGAASFGLAGGIILQKRKHGRG